MRTLTKLNSLSFALIVAFSGASAAYAQNTVADDDMTVKSNNTASAPVSLGDQKLMHQMAQTKSNNTASAPVSVGDQKLMHQIAQTNLAEVAVGELAKTKSSNEGILKYAQHMIDDHTQAMKDLSKLAEDRGVKLPTITDQKHQDALKKMNTMTPEAFDEEYIAKAAKADHKAAKDLVAKTSKTAKDPDLKALADKMAPIIDMHLKMAQDLKAN